jgi:hypothetical protein
MGYNRNLGGNAVAIKGRPTEHEATIKRQGQWVRLLHARKCACITNGRPDLFCTLCKGKGYRTAPQDNIEILEENSSHYEDGYIYPDFVPIHSVKKVQRYIHYTGSGNVFYTVDTFNNTSIKLVDNGQLPKKHESIRVTYKYKNYEDITNENCTHDGTNYLIFTKASEIDTSTDTSNPMDVFGDIVSVSRIYNVTQDITYTLKSFSRSTIKIDDESGTVDPPLSTDVLQVDYRYVKPIKALVTRIKVDNSLEKFAEDLKINDVTITLNGSMFISRGDVFTVMTTILKGQSVITRGYQSYDEIPAFDVTEIIDTVEDEDGNTYNSTKWELQEYNNFVWITSTKPAQGKKYTLNYLYRPTYQIYRQQNQNINMGDRRYPHRAYARLVNRLNFKDIEVNQ